MVSVSPTKAGNGATPQKLTASSRLTDKQKAFASLIATGLNSAADAYRQGYKISSAKDWWCRVNAYRVARLPHVAAEITRLRAQYESVRPSLTRVSKREILHGMATDEQLDPVDRQRAVDIDNKMQGEYQERMHLTADVSVSMFRANGAIPWQLAESLPVVSPSQSNGQAIIEAECTPVVHTSPDGGTGTLAIHDSPEAPQQPVDGPSSSPESEPIPAPRPPAKRSAQRTGQAKLTPLQRRALRGPRAKG